MMVDSAAFVSSSDSVSGTTTRAGSSFFARPSVTGIAWAGLDVITIVIACLIALRFRTEVAVSSGVLDTQAVHTQLWSTFGLYLAWFAACLVTLTRSYGLYGPIQNRGGLNEQRMTIQATLVSGLILCGTLYQGQLLGRECELHIGAGF